MYKAERKYGIGKIRYDEQTKQRILKDILNKLTPCNLRKLFYRVKQVNIDNAYTLCVFVEQIFDKALMEPNFVEVYANLCSRLSVELPDLSENGEKVTFKRLLINKCQEEFERGEREKEEANRTEEEGGGEVKQTEEEQEEAGRRKLGNIRLIGELYKKRMLTERIMHECIKKLLGINQTPDPDEENIEVLCKLMSTTGEMIDHPKAKEHMDAYFDKMLQLSNNMDYSSRVRLMLEDIIDLRKDNWQQRKKYKVGKIIYEEQAKQRQMKGILDKLTPQNFEKSIYQVKVVKIDNANSLGVFVEQVFEKALMEPAFVEMYANYCSRLSVELPDFSENGKKMTFKRLLLNRCQEEFKRRGREEEEANRTEEEGEVKQTEEEPEEKRVYARRRMLGNIRLIGELYKKRMLPERIMHECIKKLLGINQTPDPDEENIEALCILMSTIGEMIDHRKTKEEMDVYFDIMFKLSNNMARSSLVRIMLKDAIDLRKHKWRQRKKVEGPKKKDKVLWEAAQERQAQANRLACGPSSNPLTRRAQMDFHEVARVTAPLQSGPLDKVMSEERYKSIAMIKEFYRARDEKEVALCIRDLNAPSFYPSMISIWVIDSFERKEVDRESLTKLLINLAKPRDGILSQDSLVRGFESVLSTLEDAVNDAPKAAEFLGRIFAQVLLENVIPYTEVWRLIYEGGEEQGRLVEVGLAAEVLGVILEIIKSEKGDPFLNNMCMGCDLRLESFRPPTIKKTLRLDNFI